MNFFGKLKDAVSSVGSKIKKEFDELVQENDDLKQQEAKEEQLKKNKKLPWEGVRVSDSKSNGNMADIIKEEILSLSSNPDNFMIEEENYMYEFQFNVNDYTNEAIAILEYDENLARLRNKMVPSKISDEKFWKNYFYNVEVIKMKYNVNTKIGQKGEENTAENPDPQEVLSPEEHQGITIENKESFDEDNELNIEMEAFKS